MKLRRITAIAAIAAGLAATTAAVYPRPPADRLQPMPGARHFDCGSGGHSSYFKPGSIALRNLAYIALGDLAGVTR